jgi:hypothetical protein
MIHLRRARLLFGCSVVVCLVVCTACTGAGGASDGGAAAVPPDDGGPHPDWLDPMNKARADVGEAPLRWDPIAAQVAQSWANRCAFMHDPGASDDYASRGGAGGLGENIAAGAPSQSVGDAVASWIGEKADYDHATNTCAQGKSCGHYTQIVWAATTGVGCAHVSCTTDSPFGSSFPSWDFSVCDYSPPGNFVGQPPY